MVISFNSVCKIKQISSRRLSLGSRTGRRRRTAVPRRPTKALCRAAFSRLPATQSLIWLPPAINYPPATAQLFIYRLSRRSSRPFAYLLNVTIYYCYSHWLYWYCLFNYLLLFHFETYLFSVEYKYYIGSFFTKYFIKYKLN